MANYQQVSTISKMAGNRITTDPTTAYDQTEGWNVGDTIINTVTGVQFHCIDNTPRAAIWGPVFPLTMVAARIGANMNTTADQFMGLRPGGTGQVNVTGIIVTNASIPLTTVAGGIYRTTSKGGTALVAASQRYSALVSPTDRLSLPLNGSTLLAESTDSLYLSLTTPQGAAATADFLVYGVPA